ncbi:T9SS type A sorting domain-containing protein [Pseudoflavitalea sp. X16]|uniref:PKD domain-containing protein n=1 Tax=Paraflavitalea devenefica TaxID=2716334 RepID=UPI00141E0628|nr:T9SS type A sorting domain-containing protein [Paraflavitalea devenefica]NII23512.1 T9SS type A sorting domain-containing protein [Paraflavitalea devenefica]
MKTTLLVAGILMSALASGQQVAKSLTASNGVYIGFYQYTPTDYNPSGEKYPLIIFLHGMGERGNGTTELTRVTANGIPKYIKAGHKMRFFWNGKWQTFLVLSPQLSSSYGWWENFYTEEMIKYAKANLNVDTNRIALAGLSLGGGGVWYYPGESVAKAKQLSAVAPCCPTCQSLSFCNLAAANLPVWAFHAQNDPTTQASCTSTIVSYINNNCSAPVKGYMTLWPTGGHGVWDRAFDTVYNWQNPNVYEWMLGQDKSKPVNVRPVANAGSNFTISTSSGIAYLSGAKSTDADGTIQRYVWKQTSGPVNSSIVTPVSTDGLTRINGLTTAGTYVFELTVADDRADFTKTTITVTVVNGAVTNVPPVTEAGININTAVSSTTLHGSDSYDPDGAVLTYKWTKVAGPAVYALSNDAVANPDLSNLLVGTYQFRLETTDAQGAKTQDLVSVTSSASMLPTKLLYFKANTNTGITQLSWSTAMEEGNDHFDVESSADGKGFTTIGSVQGAGSTMQQKSYTFTDPQVHSGTWYYRLKLVNANGQTIMYSSILPVKSGQAPARLEYFPNPVAENVTVQLADERKGTLQVRLLSMDGKLVKQRQWMKKEESITVVMEMAQLVPGIYLMEITVGDQLRELRKIIKK